MTNFAFLKEEYPELYEHARKAEKNVYTDVIASAFFSIKAMELGVYIVFEKEAIDIPYNTNVGNLIQSLGFEQALPQTVLNGLDIIRRTGNVAKHKSKKKLTQDDAQISVEQLFNFCFFIVRAYSLNPPQIEAFNSDYLPRESEEERTKKELEELRVQLEALSEEKEKELRELRKQLLEHREEALSIKQYAKPFIEQREKRVRDGVAQPPSIRTEAETRKHLIDLLLAEAGWDELQLGKEIEFELNEIPETKTGKGRADYVLWSDSNLPLAVIEAKRTMTSPEVGKHQAKLYADSLEKEYGQRPIIYFSNGYDNFIWDDRFYPERKVSGFHTKEELELLIQRRSLRKDLSKYKIKDEITNRPYQKEAIKRVADTLQHIKDIQFVGKKRKALLVMATGSGKTRTACSLVDMLTKSGWVKRVLFLADRNALVTQAKNAFQEHLPHLSAIDLTKEKEDNQTRLVFSTYPTMLNRINHDLNDGVRTYSIGHFDLVIIDEAHRSVYKKYGAIFDYFDSLLIGLTATPKDDIDHDTFSLFGVADQDPTFSYDLDEAVTDGYLVPYQAFETTTKFLREGVSYDELSEEEQLQYEELIGDSEDDDFIDYIESERLNSFLFNQDTVDKVLVEIMQKGIKGDGETRLGKTIIFARNHRHAMFIQERFNQIYPEFTGDFLQVIDNKISKAQDLLEKFCDDKIERSPQIAVSVDMMDTGVDAPRVVNLVFFKPIRSKSKFWQMIGRGTRLRPNLFGPGLDKSEFYIFDLLGNFDFFRLNPDGEISSTSLSIVQQLFKVKIDIAEAINNLVDPTNDEVELREILLTQLFEQVQQLNPKSIEVRNHWELVDRFKHRDQWNQINSLDRQQIIRDLASIVPTSPGENLAIRFDLLMLNTILLQLLEDDRIVRNIQKISNIGQRLEEKKNIQAISEKISTIRVIQQEKFWKKANGLTIERIRREIRDLLVFLDTANSSVLYSNFEDELEFEENISDGINNDFRAITLTPYKDRVEAFIKDHSNDLVIHKLYNNESLSHDEWQKLETFLINGVLESKEKYTEEFGDKPLGKFVRSIIGVNQEILNQLFSEFISDEQLTPNQIIFIRKIIDYVSNNGSLDLDLLAKPPFTSLHQDGLFGIIPNDFKQKRLVQIIQSINEGAEVG